MTIGMRAGLRPIAAAVGGLAALLIGAGGAMAQTYGLATMQPGTLSYTSAASIAKVLKEKGGFNVLVPADRRRNHADPAGRARRVGPRHRQHLRSGGRQGGQPGPAADRLVYPLRGAFWVRKERR